MAEMELIDLIREVGLDGFREVLNEGEPACRRSAIKELTNNPDIWRTFSRDNKLIKDALKIAQGIDQEKCPVCGREK